MDDRTPPDPHTFRGRTVDFDEDLTINPLFARPGATRQVPQLRMPDDEMLPDSAFQIVHDEAMLDGNARLNLATFVSTWMDGYAQRLAAETADKNLIDKDEYPQTAAVETRCWTMLADLWHCPDPDHTIGTSTVGSSEACMLAGIAFKRRWQDARRVAGKSTERPNLVMSSAVQVCWEKFCNYFEVEPRYVPVSEEHPALDARGLADVVDEHTIGVVAILGVTYTGAYEDVEAIAAELDRIGRERGLDVPIHVDAASGGMIAPFLTPSLRWDFRLDRVASINTSGHKYGLVYPGVGWVVWRDRAALPESMVFEVSYLGGTMPTLTLNFSRPGAQVLLQYYLFLRLGRDGYARVQHATMEVASFIASGVGEIDAFRLWQTSLDTPVVAWRMAPGHDRGWDLHALSERLRAFGWLVPAYPLPDDLADQTVMRVVVRNGLSRDLASAFLRDLRTSVADLDERAGAWRSPGTRSFHH